MSYTRISIFFNAPWAFFTALVIVGLEPFYRIRIVELHSTRIGHFVGDAIHHSLAIKDIYKKELHIYWFHVPTANSQWEKMVKRNLLVLQYFKHVDYWIKKIPGGKNHSLCSDFFCKNTRDTNGNLERMNHDFVFHKEEDEFAKNWLKKYGWKEGQPFVCLLVRDSKYLTTNFFDPIEARINYHRHRDSDIKNYELGIKWLLEQGVMVIRMGKIMHRPISFSNDLLVDYPFCEDQSDLIDIWLFSKCELCISTLTGADYISDVYRRPLLLLNYLPLVDAISWSNATCIPKKLVWENTNEELTLKETIEHSYYYADTYQKVGIRIVDLGEEQILSSIIESWNQKDEEEKEGLDTFYKNFWDLMFNSIKDLQGSKKRAEKKVKPLINYHDWIHPEFKMGKGWINSRSNKFFN